MWFGYGSQSATFPTFTTSPTIAYTGGMTSPPIAAQPHARYDLYEKARVRAMADETAETAADIERRLREGAWLKPGEVATLFGKSRWAVDYWLRKGVKIHGQDERLMIGYRESPGRHRECDPADIVRLLESYRTRRTTAPRTSSSPPE